MFRRLLPATLFVAILVSACGGSDQPDDGAVDLAGVDSTAPLTAAPTEPLAASTPPELAPEPGDDSTDDDNIEEELFPDVVDATATFDGAAWTIAATLSSPYDSPERYADGWRVVGPDGSVYGERILTHDHASEQPFTRSESGIEIPGDVIEVTIEGRDQVSGYGGQSFVLSLST